MNTFTFIIVYIFTCKWFIQGLSSSLYGPTLPDLQDLFQTDLKSISAVFTASSFGFICGSLVCGGLFERLNFELEMAVSGSMVALFVMLLPWMGIGWFLALTALRGASMGIFDTGNNIR